CGCGTSGDVQVLQLPYAGHDLSMFLFLPAAAGGLPGLEARLTEETLIKWTWAALTREVQVTLPRFAVTTPFDLTATLRAMGMVDAFDADDFAGMVGSDALRIQAVLHKASVAVNEEGTEATAATASATAMRSALLSPTTFRADHPFLFLIRERSTRTILFLGRVTDPAHDADSW
ncbi:MAG TPA: serpin family protein, partial [Anaerolineae bacterium]|nr:serpin family protein [Anaerolineae bacterium]